MIDFNERADGVAPQLLGAVIWRGEVGIQLTEVEAYLGEADAASHAFKGPTPRCATMFGPPGHLYVYASYGIHRAGNLVCSPEGEAGGVLLRAGRVVAGHDLVRRRRGMQIDDAKLASGPGNLGKSLGLDLHLNGATVRQFARADVPKECTGQRTNTEAGAFGLAGARSGEHRVVLGEDAVPDEFWLDVPEPGAVIGEIRVGKRIGITKNADAPLRFWIAGEKTVTRPRR